MLKRNHSSLFIEDAKILVDCPEDIGDSLYRSGVKEVEHLFITHWHPDHTFWLRILLESTFDFYKRETVGSLIIHLPKSVHEDLKKHYPTISYLIDTKKMATIEYIEHGESVNIQNITITAVWFNWPKSHTYGYLFASNEKKCMYAPCETIEFTPEILKDYFINLDVLIHECWILSEELKSEISFDTLMNRIRLYGPWRTVLTHIEEVEVKRWGGMKYYWELKKKNNDISFEYAYDGLSISI